MQRYPAKFEPAPEGGFTVTFRDVPEAITQGDDLAEARAMAVDALVISMAFHFEDRRPVPAPSVRQEGEELVEVPLSVAAKALLLNEMLATRTRPVDLARAMSVRPQEVTRLLDLHHPTKIDTVAQALAALGRRLDINIS